MKRITIGTRASKLAMIQTSSVVERLHRRWPTLEILVEQIHTHGDRVSDVPLTQIGGDGVFVTEIERALSERRIDLAVHSLKDLPTTQPEGLHLAVMGPREDVRDVLVWKDQIPFPDLEYSPNLRIGTCSLRRTAQIRALYPGAQILPLRGNIDTRLRKLDAGEYDGIVLAAAGLHRLGVHERLAGRMTYLSVEAMMPAPGQGALALEMRNEPGMRALVASLNDPVTQATTSAERMFMRRLGAGCYLPVAAYGEVKAEALTLQGLVISLDGQRKVHVRRSVYWTPETALEQAERLGIQLAEQALTEGATEIIHTLLPLEGKRIVVTRASEQARAFSERLRALGAIPIEFPIIRIVPPQDWEPLDSALRKLCMTGSAGSGGYYDWLIFTSANGVHIVIERLRNLGYDPSATGNVRVAAIGPATADVLAQNGVIADLVPDVYVAEGIVSALIEDASRRGESLEGKRLLLPRAAEAREVLVTGLQQAGAVVDKVAAYCTLSAAGNDQQALKVLRMLQERQIDIVTFTSSSTVRNFMQWLIDSEQSIPGSFTNIVMHDTHIKIACIGPITSQTARELGLDVHIEAKEFTIEGLIEAIVQHEGKLWQTKYP